MEISEQKADFRERLKSRLEVSYTYPIMFVGTILLFSAFLFPFQTHHQIFLDIPGAFDNGWSFVPWTLKIFGSATWGVGAVALTSLLSFRYESRRLAIVALIMLIVSNLIQLGLIFTFDESDVSLTGKTIAWFTPAVYAALCIIMSVLIGVLLFGKDTNRYFARMKKVKREVE